MISYFKPLDFKRSDANNEHSDIHFSSCAWTQPLDCMRNSLFKILCVCGWVGLMCPGQAASQTMAPPGLFPVPSAPNASQPPDNSKRYAPLRDILPRATQESGVQFQAPDPVLREEVPVNESGPNRSLDLEPVLDEFSRIELFGNDSKLKKVIILNRNTGSSSQSPAVTPSRSRVPRIPNTPRKAPAQKPRTRAAASQQSLPSTNLSKEQLQELIRGAYRSALPENLWNNPDYREFLVGQGITSREEMNDRNKAKNVRKTVRRLLWQLKNKS